MHNSLNIEEDGLQQQKASLSATVVGNTTLRLRFTHAHESRTIAEREKNLFGFEILDGAFR